MRIGIDFGTTHTSAAYFDGHQLTYIPLDPHNQDAHILRSLIYINQEQEHSLGIRAAERFLEEDTGRPVLYEEKVIGTVEFTVAVFGKSAATPDSNITVVTEAKIEEDVGARGRLLQSIKTGLQSASYTGTKVFGREYPIQALIALILEHVRKRAEETLQSKVHDIVLGRPVMFSADPAEDQLAESRLREAAEMAGFHTVAFEKEPIAAARFYLNNVTQPERVIIFDFGGGTLDLTVLQAEGSGQYEVLATQGVLIGGDDLDSAMMRDIIAPYFGTTSRIDNSYDGRDMYLNEHLVALLERWQTIPQLSRPEPLGIIRRAQRYGEAPNAFAALETLVTQNYGFALFEKIEQAKRLLSDTIQATVALQAEKIDLNMSITRGQLNEAISNDVADMRSAVRNVVQTAGLTPPDIDTVVTTGGSSAIPRVHSMLAREFPDANFVQSDAFGSVTGGLAIQAADL